MAKTGTDAAPRGDPGRSLFWKSTIACLCLVSASGSAWAVTAKQAHDLPAPDLARLVLGETGAALVTEVERPTWPTGPLAPPPLPGEDPSRDPPPVIQIAFYTRPQGWDVTGWAPWSGLCYRKKIRVDFGAGGVARDVTAELVFAAGMSGPYGARGTAENTAALQRQCPTLPFRRFFQAPNWWSAENAIGAIDLLHRALARGPVANLTTFCAPASLVACPNTPSPELTSWIAVERIGGVEADDCRTRLFAAPPLQQQADVCYSVFLGGSGNIVHRVFLDLHVADGRIVIREARFERLHVVY